MPGARYVPAQADIVWLRFDRQAGSEQAGRRPALVISPRAYNAAVGLALVCPITSQGKGYPFEVPLPESGRARGVVLSDQLKSFDWRVRKAERLDRATEEVMRDVIARIATLTELTPGG